jgi:hypothetical protein
MEQKRVMLKVVHLAASMDYNLVDQMVRQMVDSLADNLEIHLVPMKVDWSGGLQVAAKVVSKGL